MSRRRKQIHDPRQHSLFDLMVDTTKGIREENIQADMEEEATSDPIATPRTETPELESKEDAAPQIPEESAPSKSSVPKPEQIARPSFPIDDVSTMRRLGRNRLPNSFMQRPKTTT